METKLAGKTKVNEHKINFAVKCKQFSYEKVSNESLQESLLTVMMSRNSFIRFF